MHWFQLGICGHCLSEPFSFCILHQQQMGGRLQPLDDVLVLVIMGSKIELLSTL
jgi:hypothetical protein